MRDSGVMHLDTDADGDQAMSSPVKESSTRLGELEEKLAMDELRKGALLFLPPHVVCT